MKHLIITSVLAILSSSCVLDSTILVETKPRSINTPATSFASNISLSNVQLINNQFVFTGTNLTDVTMVKIKEGGVETVLDIESKTTNQIIANTLSNVNLAAEKVFDFILSDAQAASTFTVDFTLCNTLVAGVGFNCSITPVDKDLMVYDTLTGKWAPAAAPWTATVGGDLYRLTGNVGVGIAAPTAKFEVAYSSTVVTGPSAPPAFILKNTNATASNWTMMHFSGNGANPHAAIGVQNTSHNSAGDLVFYTANTTLQERMKINSFGNVGIGVTGPIEKLEVSGNVKTTGVLFSSDRELKKDIRPLASSAEKILGLKGVEYKWRTDEYPERNFDTGVHFGFIAQEVALIFPHLVKGDRGNLAVDYTGLIAPMVEVIKSQDKKIKNLESEVQALKTQHSEQSQLLSTLMKRVEALEKK